MMSNKLKSCPMCGGNPNKEFRFNGDYFEVSICCMGCFLRIKRCNYINVMELEDNPSSILIETEQEAIGAWNRRVSEDDH